MAFPEAELIEIREDSETVTSLSLPFKEEPVVEPAYPESECSDPLNDLTSNDSISGSDSESAEPSNKSLVITELVREVFETLHNRKPYARAESTDSKSIDNRSRIIRHKGLSYSRKRTIADRRRERRANETPEETEFRLLRQRMVTMKSRLIRRLEADMPNTNENRKSCDVRRRRIEARAKETPEEVAERKRKQAEQVRKSRQRLQAIETPEQKSERKRREALRRKALQSQETPEERAARLERQRNYLKKSRIKSNEASGTVSAKTGKLCKVRNRRNRRLPSKEDKKLGNDSRRIELDEPQILPKRL